jgi:tetratricopeptide (TPR) repeat protein
MVVSGRPLAALPPDPQLPKRLRYDLSRKDKALLPYVVRQFKARRDAGVHPLSAWWRRTKWRARRAWSRLPPASRFFDRTTRYRSERGSMFRWSSMSALWLAALVALGYAIGTGYSKHDTFPRAVLATVVRPAVAAPLAFVLLTLAAGSARRALLAWLAWRPGAIVVPDFTAAGELGAVTAAQLTGQFRERIVLLRLRSATPSPGAAPEGSFLDAVDSRAFSGGAFGSLLGLAKAAAPRHALEIEGLLRTRAGAQRCGVLVQVVQQPSQASPVVEIWESSWERAIRLAADAATAAILPRTRLCKGPWAAWRRYALPPKLITAYEEASAHEQGGRFDQALSAYWEAVRQDPTNLTVRLHLGQLQEKRGLLLAALTNYQRILALGNPGRKELPRGIYRRAARREWDRALTIAKYRAIVLLAEGSILRQWSMTDEGDPNVNREKLREEFSELLEPLARTKRNDPTADAISGATKVLLSNEMVLDEGAENEALEELSRRANRAADELKLSLSRLELRPSRRPVTRRTVALTQLCINRRYELTSSRLQPHAVTSMTKLSKEVRWAGWTLGPWAGWWPSWLRRWQWHEHYNAACVYALSLADPRLTATREDKDGLAGWAVTRLERAIATRDSAMVAAWRDWVVSADPDLHLLRAKKEDGRPEDAFWAFEAMYFPQRGPSKDPAPAAPRESHRLTESRFTRALLGDVAESFARQWHARAARCASGTGEPRLLDWREHERGVWLAIHAVTQDWYDWRVRRELIDLANLALDGADALSTAFTPYEHGPLVDLKTSGDLGRHISEAVRSERKVTHEQLSKLDRLLEEPGANGANDFRQWLEAMSAIPSRPRRPISASRQAKTCRQQAETWQLFSDWLKTAPKRAPNHAQRPTDGQPVDQHEIEAAFKAFKSELHRTARRWKRLAFDVRWSDRAHRLGDRRDWLPRA